MKRFKVIRKDVRYKRKTYHPGEFLPEGFSEKDKYRTLYPSRIIEVEVPDPVDVTTPSVAEQKKVVTEIKSMQASNEASVKVQPKATVNVPIRSTAPVNKNKNK